ncbi:MAG: thioredoxin family protein [Myxococcota bacterium]
MIRLALAVAVILAAAPARAEEGPPPASFLHSLPDALERAEHEGRPVFVHFTAPWCEACREMKERVYPQPEVRKRLARFVPVEVDVEAEGGDDLWMEYRISGLPTLVFLRDDGHEVTKLRLAGLQEAPAMVAALDRAIEALKPPPPAPPRPVDEDDDGGWWRWVLGAGLVLLLLGLAARAGLRRRGPDSRSS